jgi:hypothetical protein
MYWVLAEIVVALLLGALIVWLTLSPRPKPGKREDAGFDKKAVSGETEDGER